MHVKIRKITDSVGIDTNGEGVSRNYFFAGCSAEPKCKNCHNPGLWESVPSDTMELYNVIKDIKHTSENGLTTHAVFMGGEPLDQSSVVRLLAMRAKYAGLTVWLYTGREYSNVPKDILKLIDVIVAGKYDESLATGGFPASSNQEVVRINPRINK